jgi:hypothetical protein
MAGTAVVVLLIILLTGHTADPRPQMVSRPSDASPAPADRIRTFAQQLAESVTRDQDATVAAGVTPPTNPSAATSSASRTGTNANTVAEEARKREAQSLTFTVGVLLVPSLTRSIFSGSSGESVTPSGVL